jgi:hypothetical protein
MIYSGVNEGVHQRKVSTVQHCHQTAADKHPSDGFGLIQLNRADAVFCIKSPHRAQR